MTRISRRTILQSILGIALPAWMRTERAAGASLLVEQLRRHPDDHSHAAQQTFYRADATILLLSIPIYKRQGAGGGCVELRSEKEQDRDTLSIRFTAGSYPEQARGLNRLGYIEEFIVSRGKRVEELAYFGFMTSSPEKDVSEAKKSMEKTAENAVTFSAAEGHIHSGVETSRKSKLNMVDARTWTQADLLRERIRSEFLNDDAEILTRKRDGSPATFLFSLLSGAWSPHETFEAAYSYLGKDYRINVEKKRDLETGRSMAKEGLTQLPESVVVLKGTIVELAKNKSFRFRLWAEDTGRAELPLRFEYRPRTFLRVSFERTPAPAPAHHS